MAYGFAEANARVDDDPISGDPSCAGELDALFQKSDDF